MGKYKVFNFPTSILIFYLVILNCKYVNQFNWITPLYRRDDMILRNKNTLPYKTQNIMIYAHMILQ